MFMTRQYEAGVALGNTSLCSDICSTTVPPGPCQEWIPIPESLYAHCEGVLPSRMSRVDGPGACSQYSMAKALRRFGKSARGLPYFVGVGHGFLAMSCIV